MFNYIPNYHHKKNGDGWQLSFLPAVVVNRRKKLFLKNKIRSRIISIGKLKLGAMKPYGQRFLPTGNEVHLDSSLLPFDFLLPLLELLLVIIVIIDVSYVIIVIQNLNLTKIEIFNLTVIIILNLIMIVMLTNLILYEI